MDFPEPPSDYYFQGGKKANEILAANREFKILKGQDFRVLEAEGFESIVFGCPPGMVKEFARQNKTLPSHFVIPFRNLVRGRNNFDFEFIIYSYLFVADQKKKLSVYCTRDQKTSFRNILSETLFGPRFKNLLQAQLKKLPVQFKFSLKDQRRFNAFLQKVGADKKLFRLFSGLLKAKAGDRVIYKTIHDYFSTAVKKVKCLQGEKILHQLAKNYILCAQLKKEMDLFALVDQEDGDKLLDDLIEFHEFDRNHSVVICGKDKKTKLKIVQRRSSAFEIIFNSKKVAAVDVSHLDPPEPIPAGNITQKPFMGVTFLGVGSGFTPKRKNSCLIVWSEGKGIMVDSVPDSSRLAMSHGIGDNDILYIFLSHVHSDHDTGLAESILSGKRIRVISTRIIFESFLRKLEAITCFPIDVIEEFIDFFEVEPNKSVKLPGFKRTYMTFDYSLHSIPSGRFRLTYKDEKEKETVISHSGDTKYDLRLINDWYEQGFFSKKRYEEILGFIWDADLIIHDIGGGNLHTKLKSLDHIEDKVAEKMILVHQHFDPEHHTKFKFAEEGQTVSLISQTQGAKLGKNDAGKTVFIPDFLSQLEKSELIQFQMDELVFSKGDLGEDYYLILGGFAELIFDGKPFALYETGKIFGELAITAKNHRRKATIRAKSPLTLLRIPGRLYKKDDLPGNRKQPNPKKEATDFPEFPDPSLGALLSFGKINCWGKGENIFSGKSFSDETHILLSGKVEVQRENSPGKVILEGGCVIEEPQECGLILATVLTNNVCTLVVNREGIRRVFQMFPTFKESLDEKTGKLESDLASIAASPV